MRAKSYALFGAVLAVGLLAAGPVRAHEGHDTPGALPPAPHGGVVQEAAHKSAHAGGAPEEELFFEAVYKDKKLSLYPLALSPESTTTFKPLKPGDLSGVEAKVEMPRAKKTEKLGLTPGPNGFEASFDAKDASRFIVHVTAMHKKEAKVAKLQIEKN